MSYIMYIASWGPGGQSVGGAYGNGYVNVAQFTLSVPKPVAVGPTGVITDGYGNPTFQWTGVADATTYEVYVARNSTQIFYDDVACAVTNCSIDLTTLGEQYRLIDGSYYWYVRAQYSGGGWSPWVGPVTFTLDAAPPGLVTPGGTSGTDMLRPTFNWSLTGDAANATYFNLTLVAGSGATPLAQWFTRTETCGSPAGTSCTYTPTFDLVDGMSYIMYIASWGPGGQSVGGAYGNGYVNVAQFTVTVPKPVPTAPTGTLTTGIGNPSYQWTGIAGATQYELYVGTGAAQIAYLPLDAGTVCSGLNCSVTLAEIDPAYLLPNGSYLWYVRAMTGGVWGPWVGPTPFTVSVPTPGLVAPGAAPSGSTVRPTFSWTVPAGAQTASYFGLYLAQDGGPALLNTWLTRAALCGSYDGVSCSFMPSFDLVNGVSYTLYVGSFGPGGQSVTGGPFGNGYVDVGTVLIDLP
jgi:hypothetical protein